ncbi:hypothetical protein [Microvirga sp. VF16]|uniref:hypothetical protein n=1 Tax=Microvirga sp. VF16 TaxID=2807101 RepID=UPI00193E570D|nr:hypothetical protein [Microvirga sp. VF16]QRM35605.1 hypothetical protein JO965_43030 [Microvirga sp. VF16]
MSAQAAIHGPARLSNLHPGAIAQALSQVNWTYMPRDALLGSAAHETHYRVAGGSAARVIYSSLPLANVDVPRTVLDFGSGSGRVIRWLKPMFPEPFIEAADSRLKSLQLVPDQLHEILYE